MTDIVSLPSDREGRIEWACDVLRDVRPSFVSGAELRAMARRILREEATRGGYCNDVKAALARAEAKPPKVVTAK